MGSNRARVERCVQSFVICDSMNRLSQRLTAGKAFRQVLEMTSTEHRPGVGTGGAPGWERPLPWESPDDSTPAGRYSLPVRAAARLAEPSSRRRRRLPRLLQGRDLRARVGHLPAGHAGGQGLPPPQRPRAAAPPRQGEGPQRAGHPQAGRPLRRSAPAGRLGDGGALDRLGQVRGVEHRGAGLPGAARGAAGAGGGRHPGAERARAADAPAGARPDPQGRAGPAGGDADLAGAGARRADRSRKRALPARHHAAGSGGPGGSVPLVRLHADQQDEARRAPREPRPAPGAQGRGGPQQGRCPGEVGHTKGRPPRPSKRQRGGRMRAPPLAPSHAAGFLGLQDQRGDAETRRFGSGARSDTRAPANVIKENLRASAPPRSSFRTTRSAGQASAFGFLGFLSDFFSDFAAGFFSAAAALAFFGGTLGEFAYFFWNRSMRPWVSISFYLPVKNGWQLEQMSRCRSPPVERVSQVAPQAQWTFEVG